MAGKVFLVPSLKVICPKCVKGQQVVGDIPPSGIDQVCLYCKTTFKVRRPAASVVDDLPAAREAVPRPSDLPAAREAVPRPSDLPVSREAVPRPGDLPVSREAVPRPGDLPVSREAVPRPGDLPVSREAVPRPINLPAPKGPSFGSNLPTPTSERTPSKTPPLGLALELSFNQDFQDSQGLGSSGEIGSLNLGLPPVPPGAPKGPPDLRKPPSISSPGGSAGPPPLPRSATRPLSPLAAEIPPVKPNLAPPAPAPSDLRSQFDPPSPQPESSARTPNRTTGAAASAGNLDLGFSLELEGDSNAPSDAGHAAIPFPGARVASEGLAESAAAGGNDVPALAPVTSRGASATQALRPMAQKIPVPKWAIFAAGGAVVVVAAALLLPPLLHSPPNPESVVSPFLPELAKDNLSAYGNAADQLAKRAAEFKNSNAKLRIKAAELILTALAVHGEDPAKARRAEELLEGIVAQPKLASALGRARALLAIAKGKARDADGLLADRTAPESQLILGIARIAEDKAGAAVTPLHQFVVARPAEAVGHYLLGKALAANAGPDARKEFEAVLAVNPTHVGARVSLARLEETPEKRFAAARAIVDQKPQGGGTTELAELQLLLGQSAQALGRTPEAADAFQRAIGFDRHLIAAHLALGESLLYEGRYPQALERLKAPGPALEATPAGKFGLGGALLATGNAEHGLALVNAAAKERPEDPRGPFWLGFANTLKNPPDLPAAEQDYRDAIKREPKFLPASLRLAALLQQENKADDSLAVLRAAEEAGAPPSVLQLAWGEALIVAKEPVKAEEIFRKALAADPSSVSARLGIASALEAQDKLAESKESLENMLKSSPETLGLRERLAQICLKLGDKNEALARFQEEIQAGHATPALRLAVARIALDLGKLELVQSEVKKVLDENPRNAEATFDLARVYEARNEVGAALQEYRHATTWENTPAYALAYGRLLAKVGKEHEALMALEVAASQADGRMERGRIYYRRGEMEEALADFQAASKMTPGEAEPLILQGLCYDKTGQAAKAEEAWRAALRADPDAPEPHYRLGRMEMDRGKPAGAIEHFRKAEGSSPEKAPWRAELYFQLAQAELLTGSKAAALTGFKKYLELAPPDAPARPEATHQVARLANNAKK